MIEFGYEISTKNYYLNGDFFKMIFIKNHKNMVIKKIAGVKHFRLYI